MPGKKGGKEEYFIGSEKETRTREDRWENNKWNNAERRLADWGNVAIREEGAHMRRWPMGEGGVSEGLRQKRGT